MTKLELLAPAKNLECGMAAISHGADAVYIGAPRFGARAAAGNSIEDIAQLCNYAHQFAAKVFVTVNTIIYDEEFDDTIALIRELDTIGVDAILVQDMGLYSHLRNSANGNTVNDNDGNKYSSPSCSFDLHASTQTDNRSIEKVKYLASIGFKRVVLARELSIEEIRAIHMAVPEVELEVFVHGALCVSYSGQCYASHKCFGRSANRGECAQFCRMPLTLTDADGKVLEQQRYLLSLKDMAQLNNLERLADAGAVSFKIEGRLKDADYVKNVTAAYSERLNDICRRNPHKYERASMGHCTYTFTPDINKSFNRGFTTYFADATPNLKPDTTLASFYTPKAIGEPVGRVKELRGNSFNVSSMASFSNGDGLCFFDKTGKLVGFRVNKAEGNRLFPHQMPRELQPGTYLYRNLDHAFQALLTKPSSERKVSVDMLLTVTADQLSLTLTDEQGNTKQATMPFEYQMAQKPQEDNIRRQLTKLGNTIYTCRELKIESTVNNPFIPSSQLAELRRQATEANAAKSITNSEDMQGKSQENALSLPFSVTPPVYPLPYLYNAANDKAKAFYKSQGIEATAFETDGAAVSTQSNENNDNSTYGISKSASIKSGDGVIMQCRYCIRHELGYCTRSGRKAPWREPLSISLDDGKVFRLQFDCRNCQMNILTIEK